MWRRWAAALLVAGTVAGSAIVVVTPFSGGGGGGETANVWVNTTAGASPARCSSPCAYDSTKAYGSIQAAYAAASAGDLGLVKGGTYTARQTITNSKAGATVTLRAAAGETVELQGGLAVTSTGNLELDGFQTTTQDRANYGGSCATISGSGGGATSTGGNDPGAWDFDGASNTVVRNFEISGRAVITGNCDNSSKAIFLGGTTNVDFINGNIGPWGPEDAVKAYPPDSSDVTFTDLRLHDVVRAYDSATTAVYGVWHDDCIDGVEGDDFVFNRLKMWNCGTQGLYINGGQGSGVARRWIVKDSWIGGADATDPGGAGKAVFIESGSTGTRFINNTITGFTTTRTSDTGLDYGFVGNIMDNWDGNDFLCNAVRNSSSSTIWKYNVVDTTGGCAGDATNTTDTSIGSKLVNELNTSSLDYHLTQHVTMTGFTQANGCDPTDIDVAARPSGASTCDPGSDQFGAP